LRNESRGEPVLEVLETLDPSPHPRREFLDVAIARKGISEPRAVPKHRVVCIIRRHDVHEDLLLRRQRFGALEPRDAPRLTIGNPSITVGDSEHQNLCSVDAMEALIQGWMIAGFPVLLHLRAESGAQRGVSHRITVPGFAQVLAR
jgi:hypothetical protein